MTRSNLTDYVCISPNTSGWRTAEISKVTVHHMAGNCSVETCGAIFASPSRQASSNYGVGSDGRVGCYLDEEYHPWTSSSYWNDDRAITIEVADYDCENWVPSDAAYWATVELCADICNRWGIYPTYTGGTDGTFTEHMMYAATGCPGPWWHDHMPQFIQDVRDAMNGGDMTPEQLLDTQIATADSGNIPVWQAWSWAFNYAKRANDKCEKMAKDIEEIKSLIKKGVTELPCITKQPVAASAKIGENVEASVAASGQGLSYQWQYWSTKSQKWYNITNKDWVDPKTSKVIVPMSSGRNGVLIRCKVTNAAGSVCSDSIKFTVTK